MTSLRCLSLHSIFLKHLPPLPSLEHLKVSNSAASPGSVTVTWLLKSLSNTPSIQSVNVAVDCMVRLPIGQQFQTVCLPRLQCLKLLCGDIYMSSIFEFLEFPTTAAITLIYARDLYSHPNTLGMISLLSRYGEHPASELSLFVGIHKNWYSGEVISLALGADGTDHPLLFSVPLRHGRISDYILLLSSLPVEKVHTLEFFSVERHPYITDWVEMTRLFSNVRKLVLMGAGGIDFLRKYTEQYLWDDDPQSAINPRLSQLGFNMVDFEVRGETAEEYEALVESLDKMKRVGLPLESISLAHCSISKASVAKLEDCIPVVWDGPKTSILE
ncbi:hypothetical protein ONZ45_g9181 [Pleurotus djamor]|nr:hypothetical protein ONZ45_g9181 [Pleurotus djamor]